MLRLYRSYILLAVLAVLLSLSVAVAALGSKSDRDFDPTQRMFDDFNKAFARHWKTRTGVEVTIRQAQSKPNVPLRASVDGLKVVSLALSYDQAPIQKNSNFSLPHWDKPPPQNSPFTSTIVFLVRKGNPKNLRDWDDLTREGVQVVASNPKTSDEGRWSYLAACGYALKQPEGNGATALEFVTKLFANMKVLGRGTQNSVASFVDGGIGDVLLAWENEAHGIIEKWSNDKFEIITPSLSILAEPPVSVVSDVSDRTGAHEVPRAYIDYL